MPVSPTGAALACLFIRQKMTPTTTPQLQRDGAQVRVDILGVLGMPGARTAAAVAATRATAAVLAAAALVGVVGGGKSAAGK